MNKMLSFNTLLLLYMIIFFLAFIFSVSVTHIQCYGLATHKYAFWWKRRDSLYFSREFSRRADRIFIWFISVSIMHMQCNLCGKRRIIMCYNENMILGLSDAILIISFQFWISLKHGQIRVRAVILLCHGKGRDSPNCTFRIFDFLPCVFIQNLTFPRFIIVILAIFTSSPKNENNNNQEAVLHMVFFKNLFFFLSIFFVKPYHFYKTYFERMNAFILYNSWSVNRSYYLKNVLNI